MEDFRLPPFHILLIRKKEGTSFTAGEALSSSVEILRDVVASSYSLNLRSLDFNLTVLTMKQSYTKDNTFANILYKGHPS